MYSKLKKTKELQELPNLPGRSTDNCVCYSFDYIQVISAISLHTVSTSIYIYRQSMKAAEVQPSLLVYAVFPLQ